MFSKQIALHEQLKNYVLNLKRAYQGENLIEVQLSGYERAKENESTMLEYCEDENQDEV